MTFEGAYRRLEEISRRLEDPSTPLELSFQLYEEGQKLVVLCQTMLDDAERRFTLLKVDGASVQREEVSLG